MDDQLDLRRLDPQWRCFFDDGSVLDLDEDVGGDGAPRSRAFARAARPGYRDFMAVVREAARGLREVLLLELGRGHRATRWTCKQEPRPRDAARRDGAAHGHAPSRGTIRKRVRDARVAQMLDHFAQYVGSSPYGSPAVLCSIAHMQTGRRRVVSDGRHARRAGGAAKPRRASSASRSAPAPASRAGHDRGRPRDAASITEAARRIALSAVVSNMDSVRTYRELVGGAPGAALRQALEARAGLLRASCSISASTAPTSICCTTTSCSRATRRRSSTGSTARASRRPIRPATSPRPRAPSPAWRRPAARRSTCSCTRPICARITTGTAMLPRLSPRHPRQARAHAPGMQDLESRIVVERVLTPQDIHDRYRVLNGAIYGLASHGRFFGAFKPGNRSRDLPGPLSRRRRRASRAGHADGADVRLDRGRRARHGPQRPTGPTPHEQPHRPAREIADRAALAGARLLLLAVSALVFRAPFPRGAALAQRACRRRRRIARSSSTATIPSWWDPALFILISARLMPARIAVRPDGGGVARQIRAVPPHGRVRHRARHAGRRGALPAHEPRRAAGRRRTRSGSRPRATSPMRASARCVCAPASRISRAVPEATILPLASNTRSGTKAGRRRWLRFGPPVAPDPERSAADVDGGARAGARPRRWTRSPPRAAHAEPGAVPDADPRWRGGRRACTTSSAAPAPGPPGHAFDPRHEESAER